MKIKATVIGSLFGIFIFGNTLQVQAQNEDISSTLKVYKITTNEQGEEVQEKITAISPGDTLEYGLTYTNNLSRTISNLQAVLPIPAGVRYLANTAMPEVHMVSLDANGDTFQSIPIQREETTPSGLTEEREVPASEYRRLRWTVTTLDAQESVTLTARMWVIEKTSL